MTIKNILTIIQIVLAGVIITLIMLQNRGSGLGSAFGSDTAVFRARRGAEKIMHYGTIFALIIFFFLSLLLVWFQS